MAERNYCDPGRDISDLRDASDYSDRQRRRIPGCRHESGWKYFQQCRDAHRERTAIHHVAACESNRDRRPIGDVLRYCRWHSAALISMATRHNSDFRSNFIELHHSCYYSGRQWRYVSSGRDEFSWKYFELQRNAHRKCAAIDYVSAGKSNRDRRPKSATFSVVATGTAPLSYQWQEGTTPIPGAISASYTTPVTASTDNGETFQVVVTNSAGNIFSTAATLTVNVPPSITSQPANQTVVVGQAATFSVVATGTAPLPYQWQEGTTPIPGATSSSYTTPETAATDNGETFQVVVTNSAGNISSTAATLTVNIPPSITTQPADQTVTVGQTATFTVVAAGTARRSPINGSKASSPISGAISASYTTPATSWQIVDTFQVVVTNAAGSITSNTATLTVNPASGPLSVSITSPASGGSVSGTIQVTATVSDGVSTVTGVQFQVDGLNLGAPVTSAPYSVSLDTTAVANSTHTLTAIATDAASNQATSTVSTTVSNTLTGIPPGPLRVSTVNPRYFTSDGSHAVLLAGDHTWANLRMKALPLLPSSITTAT